VRAVTIVDQALELAERPDPQPGPGEVQVRVHGAGVNRADVLQRAGRYPSPPGVPADIPGMEFAGEVSALGEGVTTHAVGDRVFGIVGGGAQAELLTTSADACAPIPGELDLVTAGGIPEVYVTAHDAMRTRAGLQAGEHVVVHAVGSGVGIAVLQLAKALGCTVTGTARTAEKLDRALELGLDHAVLAPRELDPDTFAFELIEHGGPADVVIDLVGGPYVAADLGCAAVRGRVVVVGTLAGGRVELPLLGLMGKRLELHGTVLRARTIPEKAAAIRAFVDECEPWLADGTLRPVVERVLPLGGAQAAYDLLASDATFGKVILDATG
jgi:putative PIG3 family NAD(P)H quinone oxidoreductase